MPRAEPRSASGNPPFYEVGGHRYVVLASAAGYRDRGVASWYGPDFHGLRTATGERYDMFAMTAAHKTLPIPCYARVTNLSNGRSVVVRINDRGPFVANRIIDLSYTAANRLDMIRNGTAFVEVETLLPGGPASTAELPVTTQAASAASAGVSNVPPVTAPLEPAPAAPAVAVSITSHFYIQVGAYSQADNARRAAEKLRNAGLRAGHHARTHTRSTTAARSPRSYFERAGVRSADRSPGGARLSVGAARTGLNSAVTLPVSTVGDPNSHETARPAAGFDVIRAAGPEQLCTGAGRQPQTQSHRTGARRRNAAAAPTPAGAPGSANIPSAPDVDALSYILTDYASGKVLAERDADERVEPASLTKLMTCYAVFHALKAGTLKLNDMVTISEHAWRAEGSRTFVQVGSQVPAETLIKGMIVQSGNDATIALAERVGGTEPAFVQLMNEYARRLGMTNTHFDDSSGLPSPTHYSTARDLSRLGRALVREFPEYYAWFSHSRVHLEQHQAG